MNIYSSKSMPYVYMCIHKETKKFYIGYRCANTIHNRPSHLDLPKYKSSNPEIKKNFNEYDWFIVAEFFHSDSAYDYEQQLIHDNWYNPLLMNKSCFYLKKRFKPTVLTEDHKRAISIAQSKPKTEIHRKKLSDANKGKHWYNNGEVSIQSAECPDNFVLGRLIKSGEGFSSATGKKAGKMNLGKRQKITSCPQCGTVGGISTLKQHHFNKCSSLILYKIENCITHEILSISKKEFKEKFKVPLYPLLNGHVKTLRGWKLLE